MEKVYCNQCDKDVISVNGECPICGLKFASDIVEPRETKDLKDTNFAKVMGVITAIIFIVLVVLSINDNTDSIDKQPKKYIKCENRSDTYHKCSWSISEDRCICKQR